MPLFPCSPKPLGGPHYYLIINFKLKVFKFYLLYLLVWVLIFLLYNYTTVWLPRKIMRNVLKIYKHLSYSAESYTIISRNSFLKLHFYNSNCYLFKQPTKRGEKMHSILFGKECANDIILVLIEFFLYWTSSCCIGRLFHELAEFVMSMMWAGLVKLMLYS